MDRPLYPFTAVVGQERAKQALLCLAVEPRIGGVLLCGEKGTAKSTLVRALGGLEGVRLLELPVSATEDMLLGGVELEAAVRTGCRTFQPGLLARADGAVLYADEVNLLPSALTAALLDTLDLASQLLAHRNCLKGPAAVHDPPSLFRRHLFLL